MSMTLAGYFRGRRGEFPNVLLIVARNENSTLPGSSVHLCKTAVVGHKGSLCTRRPFKSSGPKGLLKFFENIEYNRTNGAVGNCLVYPENKLLFMEMRI